MGLLNLKEAARELNVSPHTLRQWVHRGEIPYIRAGVRLLRFRPQDLKRFVRENLVEAKCSSK